MSIAKHGARVFATNWVAFPLQLLTGIVVVRVMGADGKGALVLLTAAIGLLAMIAQVGMPASAVYLLRSGRYSASEMMLHFGIWAGVVTVGASLAAAASYPLFNAVLLGGATVPRAALGILMVSLPAQLVIAFVSNLLIARTDVLHYARLTVSMAAATLLLTLALIVVIPGGLLGAIVAIVVPQIGAALYGILRLVAGEQRGRVALRAAVMGDLLRIGSGHYAGTIGSQMFKRLDSFLVAYFLGAAPVGYYSVAMTAYEGALSIPRALSSILGGEAAARGAVHAGRVVARASRVVLWVMLGLGGVVGVMSIWAVPLIYGADFIASVLPLQILLAAAAMVGTTIALQAYFLGLGRPGISGMLTLLSGAVNLLLSLWLIPLWGLAGNALATLLAGAGSLILHLAVFRRMAQAPLSDALVCQRRDLSAVWAGARNAVLREARTAGPLSP